MNRISIKILGIVAIFLFIAIMPIAIFAANEDVSIVRATNSSNQQGYMIYIKDYSNQAFKYAFSNTYIENPGEMDLSYINSISDLGENQVAFLNITAYEELSKDNKPIYMWAKDESENVFIKGIQLDFTKAITAESIDTVENLTSRIDIKKIEEEDTTTIKNENVNGVEQTTMVGYIQILDDQTATYYYEMEKMPSATEQYNELKALAEKINNEYDGMDIYQKLQFVAEFNNVFSTVTSNANWQAVKDMMVTQPETSVKGDEYIVLLKKVDEQGNITTDVQFLTADEGYIPNLVTEEIVTQETTKLPITYDSIALFVILAIIVVLVIAVFIRMKKLNKQDEEK